MNKNKNAFVKWVVVGGGFVFLCAAPRLTLGQSSPPGAVLRRPVKSDYPRKLAEYGKVRMLKISERISLYCKADIDAYIVEVRGKKSGRAKWQRAKPKGKKYRS